MPAACERVCVCVDLMTEDLARDERFALTDFSSCGSVERRVSRLTRLG